MLKLTVSFYRYLWLTCENIYSKRVHVKQFSHLCSRRSTLKNTSFQRSLPLLLPLQQAEQLRLLVNKNKKINLTKIFLNSNELKKKRQMSDTLQPSQNHVSFGGQFNISDSEGAQASSNQWRKNDNASSGSGLPPTQQIPSNFRAWEKVCNRGNKSDGPSFKFKVVSYNVLAQYLLECHPYLYKDCHPYNLKWKVRSARLYDEIMQLAPDILCLQEVQASHMSTFYDKFEKNGYFGLYKQKTGQRHDGCAIYFKRALFHIIDHVTVEYYQPELPILNRDNIGIMVKLAPKASPTTPFVVATTHLLFNPKRTDVRLAQMQVLLAEIDRFAYHNNGRECGHLPIILTGDFNSKTYSAVVELLELGEVNSDQFRDNSNWQRIEVTDNCQHLSVYLGRQRGDRATEFDKTKIFNSEYSTGSCSEEHLRQNEMNNEHTQLFNTGVVRHSLKLASVYDKFKSDGEHEATTVQDYWQTVDYIYFSRCSTLRLIERLRLPTAAECSVLGCLPNDQYASDHLALAALFELRLNKSNL